MLTKFENQVLQAVKKIPKGKVVTYKQLAMMVGRSNAARAIGNVLKKNPHLIKIPCHRVVKSNGEVGGYVVGRKRKVELLESEGIKINNCKISRKFYLNPKSKV